MSITNISRTHPGIQLVSQKTNIVRSLKDLSLLYMRNDEVIVNDLATASVDDLENNPLSNFI